VIEREDGRECWCRDLPEAVAAASAHDEVRRTRKVDIRLPGKVPWREAGPPNHLDDKVDSDQSVVNKELSVRCHDLPEAVAAVSVHDEVPLLFFITLKPRVE